MKKRLIFALSFTVLAHNSAQAINAKYRQQLDRSGCTQVSETQGCDIAKTKKENAKAGFVTGSPAKMNKTVVQSPYAGQWLANTSSGAIVATIRIDAKDRVWVNGKRKAAKHRDGALVFQSGKMAFTIHGDRRLKNEDYWIDSSTGTKGPIVVK